MMGLEISIVDSMMNILEITDQTDHQHLKTLSITVKLEETRMVIGNLQNPFLVSDTLRHLIQIDSKLKKIKRDIPNNKIGNYKMIDLREISLRNTHAEINHQCKISMREEIQIIMDQMQPAGLQQLVITSIIIIVVTIPQKHQLQHQ